MPCASSSALHSRSSRGTRARGLLRFEMCQASAAGRRQKGVRKGGCGSELLVSAIFNLAIIPTRYSNGQGPLKHVRRDNPDRVCERLRIGVGVFGVAGALDGSRDMLYTYTQCCLIEDLVSSRSDGGSGRRNRMQRSVQYGYLPMFTGRNGKLPTLGCSGNTQPHLPIFEMSRGCPQAKLSLTLPNLSCWAYRSVCPSGRPGVIHSTKTSAWRPEKTRGSYLAFASPFYFRRALDEKSILQLFGI